MQVKLKVNLRSKNEALEYNVVGDITDNEIYYEELDDNHTSVIFNIEDNILKRDNKDLYMEYYFNEPSKSNILIKDINKKLDIDLVVKNIKKSDNKVSISYEFNNVLYKYDIKIKENKI